MMAEWSKQGGTALVRAPELYFLPSHGSVAGYGQAEKTNGQTGTQKQPGRGR